MSHLHKYKKSRINIKAHTPSCDKELQHCVVAEPLVWCGEINIVGRLWDFLTKKRIWDSCREDWCFDAEAIMNIVCGKHSNWGSKGDSTAAEHKTNKMIRSSC